MKYNKQLSDAIHMEYYQLLNLSEFIFDQMLSQKEEYQKYDVLKELDIYIQAALTKLVLDNEPKNPALFNMLKKLSKYESFYHGINLDDWFKDKAKVINLLINKSNQVLDKTPVMVEISAQIDNIAHTTEFSYQLLESMISLLLILVPEQESFEEVEETIINKYLKAAYSVVQK